MYVYMYVFVTDIESFLKIIFFRALTAGAGQEYLSQEDT